VTEGSAVIFVVVTFFEAKQLTYMQRLLEAEGGHFSANGQKSVLGRVCKLLNSRENFGAGDRDRTGDVQLGKLAFYR
jgi:hypothetical protein